MMRLQSNFPYKKISLILTLVFFLITFYVAFFHNTSWIVDADGTGYLHAGEEILRGNAKNVKIFDAPLGGPIFVAFVNSFFDEGFSVMKMISVLSGSGAVFISFYILNNIVKPKTALLGQIFFAFHPFVGFFSIQADIDIFPVFFTMASLYFITKKDLNYSDIIFSTILVGIAFMIRTQAITIFITIIIFLIIRYKDNIRKNSLLFLLVIAIFAITLSPLMYFNFSTYGVMFDHDASFYLQFNSVYQTPEWKEQIMEIAINGDGTLAAIFTDFDLFTKNYIHNLFYNSPNRLFNFFDNANISPIPVVPLLGMIPILVGLAYIVKTFKKNYGKNILPLLLLPLVFCLIMSIVHLNAGEQFLMMWISISMLTAIFFSEFVPSKIFKQNHNNGNHTLSTHTKKKILLFSLIVLILLSNFGYSYVMYRTTSSYQAFENIPTEIELLVKPELMTQREDVVNEIWEKISTDPDIKNSYVIAPQQYFVPFGEGKYFLAKFDEGPIDDTIENYITRKNWDYTEVFHSNVHSVPMDRLDLNHPIPKYIIHVDRNFGKEQHDFIKILNDPSNVKIPSNFENIYFSKELGISVYKITNFE